MSTPDQVRVSHGLQLMSRLESMNERELICDYTIKVGNKSFPVHRAVLVASSVYFEGMFSSNMKEVQEGCVEMKNLGVNATEQAIEFMYTGSAKITMESVQDILHVVELFQLDGLKNLCFHFLLDNLSPQNCLSVIHLAQTYNRRDVKEKAERIVVTDFEAVISSEMFPLISRSNLLRYISNMGYETSWKAAITWAKDKEEFPQLIEGMDIKKFPFNFLLETVLEEPLVKKSESTAKLVIGALFSDTKKLEENLGLENCISLKKLARQHCPDDVAEDAITRFLKENFEKVTDEAKFGDITKKDVIALFQSHETKYSAETVKWEAAMKWLKHDCENRKKFFPELFSFIKLEDFPSKFLRDTICNESLVRESRKCGDILMDVVISRAVDFEERSHSHIQNIAATSFPSNETNTPKAAVGKSGSASKSDIVIINRQPPSGKFHMERGVTHDVITYSFAAGDMQEISFPSQEFRAYLLSLFLNPLTREGFDIRQIINRLEKAFNAGQVFKLEHRQNQQQGRIVWGDIPHKTDKTGGIRNSGYPDPGYMKRLYDALKSKGF